MTPSRTVRRIDRGREHGAILPIMGLVLVALLVLAAIVVDLGGARETRRRNQGGDDAAALAAAQDLPVEATALTTIQSILAQNIPGFTNATLNTCSGANADPSLPAGFTPYATANCVSFTAGADKVRVYLPGSYKTAFGAVIH